MQKLKSTLPNMVIVLGLIAAITSSLLAVVYVITKEPIAKVQADKLNNAIAEVVPGLDRFEDYQVTAKIEGYEGDVTLTFYDAYKNDVLIGTAVKSYDNGGFNGLIEIMVGFDADGNIINNVPLKQSETPGLGAKIDPKASDFVKQFNGKHLSSFDAKVSKDGGEVDAITAATITSRAYCNAINLAYKTYMAEKGESK